MKEKEHSRDEFRKMSSSANSAASRGKTASTGGKTSSAPRSAGNGSAASGASKEKKPPAGSQVERRGTRGSSRTTTAPSNTPTGRTVSGQNLRNTGNIRSGQRTRSKIPGDALQQTLNGGNPKKKGLSGSQIALITILAVIAASLLAVTLFLFKPGRIQLWNIASGNSGETVIQRLDPPEMQEEPVVPAETVAQAVKPVTPPVEKEETPAPGNRDTRIYFVKVNAEGQISLKSVTRSIDFSKAPLTQTINTLISGPASDELNKGALTLIPEGSRLLSARVEGSTAYLNFNEDFRFNPLGREGYMAQLKQIVFTSTEFPGIKDVQIMIEGVIREYLGGEGFYIGSPLSRESFQNNP